MPFSTTALDEEVELLVLADELADELPELAGGAACEVHAARARAHASAAIDIASAFDRVNTGTTSII